MLDGQGNREEGGAAAKTYKGMGRQEGSNRTMSESRNR